MGAETKANSRWALLRSTGLPPDNEVSGTWMNKERAYWTIVTETEARGYKDLSIDSCKASCSLP